MGVGEDYDLGVPLLENWLRTEAHLPQNVDRLLIKRFIHASNGDLERAKKLIDLNYTMRNTHSHIFLRRDPCDEISRKVIKATDMLILPNVTIDGYKVLFYRLADLDPDMFNFTESVKMFFIFADARFITPDPFGITEGEIPIFDMAGFTLRHVTKVSISVLRIYMKFTQEAHPIRLKEIHVINCPSYIDKVINMVKPFIKNEVFKLINFHVPGSETLYKFVPREMLPNEYGGKAGTIEDIKYKWCEILKQKRDYIMNDKYWKTDDTKRVKNNFSKDLDGSFKSLSID